MSFGVGIRGYCYCNVKHDSICTNVTVILEIWNIKKKPCWWYYIVILMT